MRLYVHPFSSYSQKALIAFYEHDVVFDYMMLSPEKPENLEEFAKLWPIQRFPILVDAGRIFLEASIVVEHVDLNYGKPPRLVPEDRRKALEVRMLDRFFDNYVSTPQQKFVFDALRAEDQRDSKGVADARAMLETSYAWLENHMDGREWAAGDDFSLADCAAGPALFYADWTHRIDARFTNVHAYRERLKARPSFARAIEEARPYRPLFPLGAPDRD